MCGFVGVRATEGEGVVAVGFGGVVEGSVTNLGGFFVCVIIIVCVVLFQFLWQQYQIG